MLACVLLLLSLSGYARADEKRTRGPLTVDEAAKRVIEIVETEDRAALVSAARAARLDPWIVAERLCQLCLLYTSPSPRDA